MQDTNVVLEVSDIIGSFDIEEIGAMIKAQITDSDNNDDFGIIIVDHFRPLYIKYKEAMSSGDEDVRNEAEERFDNICMIFLESIADKYGITIDYDWVNQNSERLHSLTIALYSFFVIDMKVNLCYTLYNYIITNSNDLNMTFDSAKSKRDAATNSFKKYIVPEMTTILANVYDVTQWILDNIDNNQFFDYMEQDYLPLRILRKTYANGYIGGDFVLKIQEMYKSSLHMRSIVCYDIIEKVHNNFHISMEERMKGIIKDD